MKTENDILAALTEYAAKKYKSDPEYLWLKSPDAAVFRRKDNKKWFALLMTVSGRKLGLDDDSEVNIMNFKCDPLMGGSLRSKKGIFPAYHMNKNSWITVLLDGSVSIDEICGIMDMSYILAGGGKSVREGKKYWLVPANPAYYDLEQDFSRDGMINWKQTSRVAVGDEVFIYMAAPVSAVIYRCEAVETDIPYIYEGKNVSMKKIMKLKLIRRYDKEQIGRSKLRAHGVNAVRGARYMPDSLVEELKISEV